MSFSLTRAYEYIAKDEYAVAISSLLFSFLLFPTVILIVLGSTNHRNLRSQPEGCKKIGLKVWSNIANEHDRRYFNARHDHDGAGLACRVQSLWVYPLKSCKGIELSASDVVITGLKFDRLFAFAQLKSPFPVSLDTPESEKAEHRWKFMTQRDFPLLAQVRTEVWLPDPASTKYSANVPAIQSGGILVISYPYESDGIRGVLQKIWVALGGQPPRRSVQIPLCPSPQQIQQNGYTLEPMQIWKDTPMALNMGSTIGPKAQLYLEELQAHLGCTNPLALFRVSENHRREVFRCAPRKEELGWQAQIGFGDAYPLHILNLASVRDLGSKLQIGTPKLSVLQFRPNIIVTGVEPYAEDHWKRIRIGSSEYHVSCRTTRCLLPNVNQNTGFAHKTEPNKTMRSFRCIDRGAEGKACLGMQMVPLAEEADIQVGNAIEVLEIGEHYYIKQ